MKSPVALLIKFCQVASHIVKMSSVSQSVKWLATGSTAGIRLPAQISFTCDRDKNDSCFHSPSYNNFQGYILRKQGGRSVDVASYRHLLLCWDTGTDSHLLLITLLIMWPQVMFFLYHLKLCPCFLRCLLGALFEISTFSVSATVEHALHACAVLKLVQLLYFISGNNPLLF
jgi:hypothetical protein